MPELQSPLPWGRFFLPGPTEVRPAVLEAMTQPMIGHRVPEMEELMGAIQPPLRDVFRTQRPVYIAPSSGTGMMEAAVRNGARRRVLSLVNGAFSQRFHQIARANGLEADTLEVEWGQIHDPQRLADALRGGGYDAVTIVHSETSTGALNPIRELAAAARAAGDVAVLVDSVSGLSGAPMEPDAWDVDFLLTGSQKSLALPPGLGFGVAQESMLERARAKADRGVYFDLIEYENNIRKNQTPNTPAVSLLYALARQLDYIRDEGGVEARWERHRRMAERTWEWVEAMHERGVGLRVMAPAGGRSPTVTTIELPAGWTGPRVVAEAQQRGFVVATGYGKLREPTFRIGHMGDHTMETLEPLLAALEHVFLEGGR
jgi:predicted phosphoserine aminotransferase